jgi:aryl carrier-like protein
MTDHTPATPVSDALRTLAADMIGVEPDTIAPDANLVHLGLGSLEMMRLVNRWRRDGLAVSFGTLAAEPTLEAWQRHLDSVAAESGKASA